MKGLEKYVKDIDKLLEIDNISQISIVDNPKIPDTISYDPTKKTTEELIDILATRIGRLENVAIRRLIDDLTLTNIMLKYLSAKDLSKYHWSRARLSQLLLGVKQS